MTECYYWDVPSQTKEPTIKVGDKVEIIDPHQLDKFLGIQVGDVAKVVYVGNDHLRCNNPRWNIYDHELGQLMGLNQIKLIVNPYKEELL
ncbi:hypothetical protein Bestia_00159 [Acinetobacter phage Bestia]|nr:hypothetical protein Bestia_00159 [Acinetobacter phage Bestia]